MLSTCYDELLQQALLKQLHFRIIAESVKDRSSIILHTAIENNACDNCMLYNKHNPADRKNIVAINTTRHSVIKLNHH